MSHTISKIIKYTLYFTFLVPLLITPFTFFSWTFGKTIIFQALVEILLFLYVVNITFYHFTRPVKKDYLLSGALAVFLAILTVTSFTGVNPNNSFWGNLARANGVFTWLHFAAWYFLLIQTFKDTKDWSKVLGMAAIGAGLVALTIIFERFLPASWQNSAGGGILGNRSFAASYLLIAMGTSITLGLLLKNKWRYPSFGVAALTLTALWTTGTRGALVGIVFGIGGGLIAALFLVSQKKIKTVVGGIMILFLLGTLGTLALAQASLFKNRFPTLANSLALSRLSSGTAETRLMAWQIAWQGIKAKPLLGWGMGNYDVIFNKYYNPQFLKHSFAETIWDKPHNWLLELGDSAGIPGIVSYLALFIVAGYCLVRKTHLPKPTMIILLATFIGYFTQNLFLFETTNALLLFFLILAFISSGNDRALEAGELTVAEAEQKTIPKFLLIPAALLLILSLFKFVYLPLKSSYYLSRAHAAGNFLTWSKRTKQPLAVPATFRPEAAIFLAERFVQLDKGGFEITTSGTVQAGFELGKVLDEASVRYPDNPLFSLWAGRVYMVLGEKVDQKYYQNAEKSLLAAAALSPEKQDILILLGRLYLLKKDFDQALSYQKKAVAVAPDIGTSHWFLGLTYVASGNIPLGLEEIEAALEKGFSLTPSQKLYVIDLYAGQKRYDKVVEWYEALHKAEPENIDWYVKLATAFALAGRKAEALQTVREAVAQYPPLEASASKFIKQYKLE